MRWLACVLVATGIGTACAYGASIADADRQLFCRNVADIEVVYARNPDNVELPQHEKVAIRALVEELEPLIPDDRRNDFLLRYWPSTTPLPPNLDTSGARTQQAYDTWHDLVADTC